MIIKRIPRLLIAFAFLLVGVPASAQSAQQENGNTLLDYRSAWECDSAKFNWYCDDPDDLEEKPAATPKVPPKPKTIKEMTTTKEINAELERLKDVAIMSPTDENVKAFALAVQFVTDKASLFADVYRRVDWQTAELHNVGRRPANQVGVDAYNAVRTTRKDQSISDLAKDNGIFFFFKSSCPYCHKLAPLLKAFQAQHGMEILPISMDGTGLPDFPVFETDAGAADKFGVDRVPALFLSNRSTRKVQPISFGMITLSEIEERIYVLTQTKSGEEF